ncbi:MAG: type II toxin-antitoxin system HicB family antitoxin [Anaerolineales bacterium]|nr:type II toxin-antitoxin system HicB family antitoxin [Anaerolineales bacterium]
MNDLVEAFHDSVDDYLTFCEERGEDPQKPYSGKIIFRGNSELHKKNAIFAKLNNKSLKAWLADALAFDVAHED